MSQKTRVLVFIDWFLPGYKAGGPIRSVANMVEHLKEDVEFLIVTSDTDYTENEPYANVKADVWTDFDVNTKVFYISKANLNKDFIANLISKTEFDTVYINGIYSYFFSILPLQILKKSDKKVVVCARGMLSEQAFSRKSLKKNVFLKLAKLKGLYKNVIFHATTDSEKTDIEKRLGKHVKVTVAQNFARKISSSNHENSEKKSGALKLVSIARISQEKNTKFALEILRKLKNTNITFDIFGSIYDVQYWTECQEIISKLPNTICVNYKGAIDSSDVPKTFAQYNFSFMPSVGENFGHSLLESMTAGTPVITSTGTPWRNLQQHNAGWDIPLDKPEEFVKIIEFCAKLSQEDYDKMSLAAQNFAISRSDLSATIKKYIELFSS